MTELKPFPAGTWTLPCEVPAGLTLRVASEDDFPLLRRIYAHSRAEEMASVPWPEDIRERFLHSQFAAQHSHYVTHFPDAGFLIAYEGDEPIGRLYVDQRGEDLHIVDISLLGQKQGRGLGSRLIGALMEHAARRPGAVTLHVHRLNHRAQTLYQRLGFTVVGESDSHLSMRWIS